MDTPHTSTYSRSLRTFALLLVGLRLGTVAAMWPSFTMAVSASAQPVLTTVTWVVASVASVVVVAILTSRRSPVSRVWPVLDVLIAVVVIGLGVLTVPTELRTGSWAGFQGGYALAVACSLIGVRSTPLWSLLFGTLTLALSGYLFPLLGTPAAPSALGHLLSMVVLAPLARLGVHAMLRVAEEADEARAYAAEVARAEEERRARRAIHNGTAVLRLLLDQNRCRADDGPATDPELWRQAAAELNRMRAYLAGLPTRREPEDLAGLVTELAEDFTDLPMSVCVDLACGVVLEPHVANVLAAGLRSLLLNVREHAGADNVVLHADANGAGWEVSLHDDGAGFDLTRVEPGVGLGDLVLSQLPAVGVSADVDSTLGVGTLVRLRGRSASSATNGLVERAAG